MRLVRKTIQTLKVYHVEQNRRVIKLNQNESPCDLPSALKQQILRRLAQLQWNRYPSGRPGDLIQALHRYSRHPARGIVVGNGSNELIAATMMATCTRGDKILIVSPGFPVYQRVARILDLDIEDVPLKASFEFDVAAIERRMRGAKLVIIASPNSPTGTVLPLPSLARLLKRCDGVFALDEAYFEFYGQTAQPLVRRFPNLLIIRTLSKAWGLAGIRLGYLLAQPGLAVQIEKTKLPFSAGLFQQTAGPLVLGRRGYITAQVESIVAARAKVFDALRRIPGIDPVPSQANFILFTVRGRSAHQLQRDLYRRGILIRHFNTPRLKNMLRVTIGKPAENRSFLQQLRAKMKQRRGAR